MKYMAPATAKTMEGIMGTARRNQGWQDAVSVYGGRTIRENKRKNGRRDLRRSISNHTLPSVHNRPPEDKIKRTTHKLRQPTRKGDGAQELRPQRGKELLAVDAPVRTKIGGVDTEDNGRRETAVYGRKDLPAPGDPENKGKTACHPRQREQGRHTDYGVNRRILTRSERRRLGRDERESGINRAGSARNETGYK